MKYSKIFLKAAESIAEYDDFSCNVIDEIYHKSDRAMDFYLPYSPARKWYCETIGIGNRYGFQLTKLNRDKDSQNRRVVMLCLAAAIAKSEGL